MKLCRERNSSAAGSSLCSTVIEAHSSEIEKVLLFVSDAQERARRASERMEQEGADPHVVVALREAQGQLSDVHRRLMQRTFYAVPEPAQQLAI
jgi:hypothetical protein